MSIYMDQVRKNNYQLPINIKLETDYDSNNLYARMIWECLFHISNAKDFESLDSFLCDLKIFEQLLTKETNNFYWEYNEESGWTKLIHL